MQIENTEHRESCKRRAVSISVPVDRRGFCSRLRRRHLSLDARSSSRHSRGNVGRERSRGGKVLPRDGLRSCRVVNTKSVAFDGMQCSLVTRRVPTCGHRGVRIGEASHPGPLHRLRRCRTSAISMRFLPLLAGMITASMTQLWTVLKCDCGQFGPPPSPTRETQLDPCRSESSADDDRPVWTVDGGRRRGQNPEPHVAEEAAPSGTRRFFSGCSARNVARRVVSTPTQLDSDDEPVMATDVHHQ